MRWRPLPLALPVATSFAWLLASPPPTADIPTTMVQDDAAEIGHARLLDGRRTIIAAYSNGRDPEEPDEQDATALAAFAALLLKEPGPPQAGP